MNTDTTPNEKSIAAFLKSEHARLGLDRFTHVSVNYGDNGPRWVVYGQYLQPIGFFCESGDTLDEAAAKYRKSSDTAGRAAKLRREAAELEAKAKEMELAQ
jgi:hypothetical protein